MEIIIDNITWDFQGYTRWDDFDDILGMAYVGIPFNMMKRFIKECQYDEDLKVPPHYFQEDIDYLWCDGDTMGTHDCYNTDTQIVLMNWLHDKQRKYRLEYRGEDPFWIYHDHCHSKGDVHRYEVNNINSHVEHYRIMEGAMMAKHYDIYMQPKTALEVVKAWDGRFRFGEGEGRQYMTASDISSCLKDDEAKEEFEFLIETQE